MQKEAIRQDEPLPDLIESKAPEKLADGFRFTEGPIWNAQGYLLFSDIPASKIYKWSERGGPEVWRDPSGNSNGLTLDRNGRLIACEHGNRRVSRTETDGEVITLADRFQGKRLNSPNDVVVRRDGMVFFTDPPYGIKESERELGFNGVYALPPDESDKSGAEPRLLVKDFNRPNGLAFSPGEKTLYVNDTSERVIRVFDVAADGTLSNDHVFANMASPVKQGGPDGMKVDREGNVYCTGPGAVWIFRRDGQLLGRIVLPELAANLAFGDSDARSLYLTARTSLYRVRVKVPGIGPAFQ